jgi:hypothetical protein
MGLLSSIRKAVKKVAKAVSKIVNKVADGAADLVETAGHLLGDGLTWLGNHIPKVGGFFRWLGAVVTSLFDVLAAIVKGAGAILGGLLSGIIRVVGGIFTFDWRGILGGLGDIVAGIMGAVIAVLGKLIALVQVMLTIGWPRALDRTELSIIHTVFDGAIATYNIRVVDGSSGVYGINNRPFTLGNLIYMKSLSATTDPQVFAHECTHIWQNQNSGSSYASEALASQFWGDGYDWEKEADAGDEWAEFGREAQGQSVEDMYRSGASTSGTGNGAIFSESDSTKRSFMFNGKDRTAVGNDAISVIRGETPWRVTALFD